MISKRSVFYLFIFIQAFCFSQNKSNYHQTNSENSGASITSLLSKYIQFNSVSGNERDAGVWFRDLSESYGLHITQMGNSDGNFNFSASIYPLSKQRPNIVFLNHIDVIPEGNITHWKEPPFSGKIVNNEIWGRGAWDNKGTAMMQLMSIVEIMKKHSKKEMPFNVTMLSVSCEETECDGGAKFVVNNYIDTLNPVVIIGEGPPALKEILKSNPEKPIFGISVAAKRSLWVELKLHVETSAHGSVTPNRYANKEMIKALNRVLRKKTKIIYTDLNVALLKQFGALEKGITATALKHPRLFKSFITAELKKQPELLSLYTNTLTLTGINSYNDVVNVIPTEITALLDCRLLPLESSEEFISNLKKELRNNDIQISILQNAPKAPLSDINNSFFKTLKTSLLECYPESGVVSFSLPNSNDSSLFREKGINAFDVVPVILGREYLESIHNYNERIPIHVLEKGKNAYKTFIENCIANY